jgi:hypothetical protein
VAVAKLFSDPQTARALRRAFDTMCERHRNDLSDLKDLRLLHLSQAIVETYA